MGSSYSKEEAESVVPNETYNSPRNVFERYAKNIRIQALQNAKNNVDSLKGDLKQATFRGAHFRIEDKQKYNNSYPCNLYHRWYTNLGKESIDERDPCYGRNPKRFDEKELSECSSTYIRSDGNESKGTACAPPRRRHLCDKNLEAINENNTQNIHDLLGNVLVTAKYEGDYIINNHPHQGTSEVCIALARSFADIGDIVRGKDMFKPNDEDEVWKGLRSVFKKINENLKAQGIKNYDDESGNYFKLREDWWMANRDKVWQAITCNAPYKSGYFMKSEGNTILFSNRKCGHYQDTPPTNLDYVPQFLRWFDEWAEEFCRKRNIKLKNVEKACRDEKRGKYCSLNGFDCTKTIWKKGIFGTGNDCIDCWAKCNPYESWLRNQQEEFKKQKEKYSKEIQKYLMNEDKSGSNINNEYYKAFYDKLKGKYENLQSFLNLLNEGKYCKEQLQGEKYITFTNSSDDKDTFHRSKYCQVCPDCGVECNGTTCKQKDNDNKCRNKVTYEPPSGVAPTEITVLYSGDEQGDISGKLSEFCTNRTNYEGKNYQKWQCYYVNGDNNSCKMEKKDRNNKTQETITEFHNFFELWIIYLLTETIRWNDELKTCINNTTTVCIDECKRNCICFDKWVKEKEKEWNNIKKLFTKEQKIPQKYYTNINNLFEGYFFKVMEKLSRKEEKWKELMENLKTKIASFYSKNSSDDLQNAIELFLEYLKEKSTLCKDHNTIEACEDSKKSTPNPCAKSRDDNKHATVKRIAQYFKRLAHAQLEERGSRGALKGDASKGQYELSDSPEDFKERLCSIDEKHSNRDPFQTGGPCYNKDKENMMFVMEEGWMPHELTKKVDGDFYMPPRRQHFCTSNVEHLDENSKGLTSDKAIHSFLGDVLLAANKQVEWVKNKYNDQAHFKDNATVCRAIKYSFANIGDMIKGTDLWDEHKWEKKTQGVLVKIFQKIKDNLPVNIKGKYNDDEKHLELRKDWWEANRDQVWKAMKCHIGDLNDSSVHPSSSGNCGYSDHTPLDDYIPQKLRWLTEWAEWYCKMQSQEYEKLKEGCGDCMGNDNSKTCWKNSEKCTSCKEASEEYKRKIDIWREQWETISDIYQKLYENARIYAGKGGLDHYNDDVDEEDKPVIDFLYHLNVQNGDTLGLPSGTHTDPRDKSDTAVDTTLTVYSTAEGYIHEEAHIGDCQKQTQFCKNKIGSAVSGADTDNDYAFKDTPPAFDDALGCDQREKPQPEKTVPKKKADVPLKEEKEDPECKTVKEILKRNDGSRSIGGCHKKSYNGWNCKTNQFEARHDGACMPPRRQKLCLYYLKELEVDKNTNENNLREAFIKAATAETLLAWYYYKSTNGNDTRKLDEQLKEGHIPEEFLRSMFYTYGDYRDICLDTDISKKIPNGDVTKSNDNIDKVFKNEKMRGSKKDDKKYREDFWQQNGPHIWKGMLCALENAGGKNTIKSDSKYQYSSVKFTESTGPGLETFAKRPQFLRWMTEWGEHFCKKQSQELAILRTQCTKCKGNEQCEGCDECKKQCDLYRAFIEEWKKHYDKQKGKFLIDRETPEYQVVDDVKNSSDAREYLKKQLQNMTCTNETTNKNCDYKCMNEIYTKPLTDGSNDSIPVSLEYPPGEFKDKCDCQEKATPEPKVPGVKKTKVDNACTIVENIFQDEAKTKLKEACRQKYGSGKYPGWKCDSDASKANDAAVCIPPRRQKLYVHNLETFTSGTSEKALRKAFIECAAIETFFLWHKFKKDKKKEKEEKAELVPISTIDEKLQKELESGEIPEEFKLQMFYTYADYKDLCLGNYLGNDVQIVKTNIDNFFKNDAHKDNEAEDTKRKGFWETNGKAIWDGMLFVLSYDTTQNNVKSETLKKLTDKYKYEMMTPTNFSSNSFNLEEFATVPQFFRWFNEWGVEFCRKQKDKLVQLKKDCRLENDSRHCNGDGYDCKLTDSKSNEIFAPLNCPSCEKGCRNYKTWIENKKNEFNKQKQKYENEHNHSKSPRDRGNGINNQELYNKLKKAHKEHNFFEFFDKGKVCKNVEENIEIDYSNDEKTFSHSEYCKSCTILDTFCKDNKCTQIKNKNCDQIKRIFNLKNHKLDTTDIHILVNDSKNKHFSYNVGDDYRDCELFKNLGKQQWECKNECNVDVCEPKNIDKAIDNKERISIQVLIKRWLEYFLKDYNKIKKNLNSCVNNKTRTSCIKGCYKNCECVKKWIEEKGKEWKNIKEHYLEQYDNNDDVSYNLKTFLHEDIFTNYINNALEEGESINTMKEFLECDQPNKSNGKSCNKEDVIEILLHRLQEKTQSCPTQHDEQTQSHCENTTLTTIDDTPDDNPGTPTQEKMSPTFCKDEVEEDTKKEEEPDSDMLCNDKKELKCDDLKIDFNNIYEPKKNLIGLQAHNRILSNNSNVYMSPRVQQLCIEPLTKLTNSKQKVEPIKDDKFSEALQQCAYNEAKSLYEYYNGEGKQNIPINNKVEIQEDIKQHTLEAMKRSYADYGNIVKGDMWWIYPYKKDVDSIIISVADKLNANHKSSNASIDVDDAKRLNLWESIRSIVWKAMLCGYKKAEGNTNSLLYGEEFCKLPSIDVDDQFSRWFIEWGENFCIRREHELKQLKDKCKNGTCNHTDENEKQACEISCKNYKEFLKNFKHQYTKQNIVYNELKESISYFQNKDSLTFLKEKCNLKYSCFKHINNTNKINNIFEYFSEDVKDECECKKEKEDDDPFKDLNECPTEKNNNICNKYKKPRICGYLNNRNSLEYWYIRDMLIPPRRRKICLRNITGNHFYKKFGGQNKFKNALLSAAASEAKFLFNNYDDKHEALQAIKYTFADIGDIIKGKDMMDDTAYKNIKVKLENILETTGNDPIATEKWWEQNKKHVWNAMLCGYKEAGGEIKPNDCNIPSEENTDQFLRWLIEWGRQVCKEKKKKKASVYEKCENKDRKKDEHCKKEVSYFNNWNTIVKGQYDILNKKYNNLKSLKSGSTLSEEDADEYIKQKCSECQCSFKDIEETVRKNFETNDDVLDVIINKSHIPPHLEDIFNRYNGPYFRCPDSKLCMPYKNIPCYGRIHNDDMDWESTFIKNNNTTNIGVLLPPRRKHLCLRIYPAKFDHLRKEINNFKDFIFSSAFAEAKRLKQIYNDNNKVLHAMKYSFSDIGNIVKGDDMMENPTSKYMEELFNKKYTEINRETWWDLNKYHVWESMLCGYKEAGGYKETKEELSEKGENCRFPDIESIPQFLRWFQEWTENFCIQRNKLYDILVTKCQEAKCDDNKCNSNLSECTKACRAYENYILLKKKEYEFQKVKYNAQFISQNDRKEAPEYLKEKCKNGKCGCLYEKFNNENNWKNPYDTLDDLELKNKCDCPKPLPPQPLPPPADEPFNRDILEKTIPFGIALALGLIAFLFMKKKPKSPVDLLRVLDIHKGDYGTPTPKSSNRYIPYVSDTYKGKTYIYMEGDSSGDEKYAFMSDTTDVTSSESEYEEFDINDIYVPGSPKYKTLIEVVLEPSKSNGNTLDDDMVPTTNTFTDEEWNELKHDFISQYLPNTEPNNNYRSGDIPMNTDPNILYFDKPEEKPFITSIHDRDLYTGEEIKYDINMTNNDIPMSDNNGNYTGIDLINDSLSGGEPIDIYDEVLKRKENELFGTKHPKRTSKNRVAKNTNSDPIDNQLNLFHTWLDRHRDMCEQWSNKEDILNKLNEEWNKDNDGGNVPSDNRSLNTDVSIQIDMDDGKPKKEFTNMDTNVDTHTMDSILDDLETYNEPFYDIYEDDVYYDVNDDNKTSTDHNNLDVSSKVQIEMDVNSKLVKEKYPISDVWDI
ncbi:erythrocyte membrane protein 1, PfEMP1, putative [Plasmodium sp. gorilla clade G1]|nr:erythrocyte membrane protein 1, PfEMP1, putative [Plasmodium sp. gorilla clade G1]